MAALSSCWSLMLNGIRPEPTRKRFNSAYLQNNFLIYRKKIHSNTFWLDKTFSYWSQVTMLCLIFFLKTKKSEPDFTLGPPTKSAKQKKVALENSLRLHTRKRCNNYFTKTFFLQSSWSSPQANLGAGRRRKPTS